MKTNARKFLSLALSFLMIFGSVATLLPTTVMAAETDATTDGSTIDCIIIDAAQIAAGGNPNDLPGVGNVIGKVVNKGLVNGKARFVSKGIGAASTANDRLVIKTGDVLFKDYPYVVMAYKTNISATNMNFNIATAEGEYPGTETKLFGSQKRVVDELTVAKYSWPGTYGENAKLAGIYVPIYSDEKGVVAAGDYMDVQYVGLFKNADDAAKFDYAAYAQRTVTVTNEDGTEVLGTFTGVIGDTVTPLEAINLPYVNKDGAFATLADAEGNAYSASALVITDNLTLKVKYVPIGGLVDANYIKNSGTTVWVNGTDLLSTSVLETINGSEYLTMTISPTGGSHNFSAMYPAPHKTADFKYIAVDAIMDIDTTDKNGKATFIRPVKSTNGKDYYGTKVFENADYSSRTFDGTAYNKQLVFEVPAGYTSEYVYGVDIAPWNGLSTNAGSYFKVRYVASFPSGEAAQAFDYDAYVNSLENDLYVTLENPAGEVISSTYVAKGGEFTFPTYTPTDANKVFVGWRSDADETVVYEAGDKLTVTDKVSFTAMLVDKFTVTLLDTDEETVLYSGKIVDGSVIDLSELAKISYRNADSDFLVWTDETNIYSDTYEVTGDITLKAKYETVNVILAEQLMDIFTDTVNTYLRLDTAALKDGKYVHFDHIAISGTTFKEKNHRNVNGHRMEYKKWEKTLVENVGSVSISYVTNKSNVSFLQFYNPVSKAFVTKSNMTDIGTSTVVDGLYYRTAVYDTKDHYQAADYTADTDGNKYFAGFKFAPFSGNAIANIGHSEETLKDENGNDMYDTAANSGKIIYSEYYYDPFVDIEYMAMFKGGPDVASAFDFDKYVDSLSYTVKFLDKYGDPVGDEETYGFCDVITLPEAPELDGHTFEGWYSVADGKLIEDGSDFASKDNTYIARYTRDTLVLTAKDIADNSLARVGINSNLTCNGLVSSTDANGYSSQYVRYVVKADAIDGTTTSTTNDLALVNLADYDIVYGNKLRNTENDYNYAIIGYKTNIETTPKDTERKDENGKTVQGMIVNARMYIKDGYTAAIDKKSEDNKHLYYTGTDEKFYFKPEVSALNVTNHYTKKFTTLTYAEGFYEDGSVFTTTTADMKPSIEQFGFLPYSTDAIAYTADHYFDIEYIAFFVTQEEAEAFDYADYSADFTIPVKLVAFIDSDANGYITVGESDTPYTHFSEYMGGNTATTLKAVPYDDYTAAYWVRFTQDSLTQVLLATGDKVEAYPLGGSVYYQPVFAEAGTHVVIYINKATREIIADHTGYDTVINETYSKDGITVYDCTKSVVADEGNLLEVYDINDQEVEIPEELSTPAFGDSVIIKKTKSETNEAPLWKIKLGDKEFTASYKDNFLFSYMFEAGTKVEVHEETLKDEAEPAISTIAVWDELNDSGDRSITRFTGLFALPAGCTLVNHGVMMSQNRDHLVALEGNTTGELNVTATTIVGRVSYNSEDAAPLFTIAKRLSLGSEVWYGRAFLVYTDGKKTTHVVYADDTLSSEIEAGEIEADYNYNPEVYNPMYWDDTIPVPAV